MGFAGVSLLNELYKLNAMDKLEIIVVTPKTVFEFLPSVPEIISNRVRVEDVAWDVANWVKSIGVQVVKDAAKTVKTSRVELASSEPLEYDYCVICWGAEPAYYGVRGARENSLPLYSVEDALRVRERLKNSKSVAIVGAGLVGSEAAAEIAWAARRGILALVEKIYLVDMLELPVMVLGNRRASQRVKRVLEEMGVNLVMGRRVIEVKSEGLLLDNGELVKADTVVWCAGVKGREISVENVSTTRHGFIRVNEYLQANRRVFVAGDATHVEHDDCVALKMVREAIRQAKLVAQNILNITRGRSLKSYKPLITSCRPLAAVGLGPRHAVVIIGKSFSIDTRLAYWYKDRQRRRFMQMTKSHS